MTPSSSIYTLCTVISEINKKKRRFTWPISQASEYINVIQTDEEKPVTLSISKKKQDYSHE